MSIEKKLILVLLFLLSSFNKSFSQEDSLKNKVFHMSIEDLLSSKVTIASFYSQNQEKAPSIVSVITNKEILSYGYRDLSDILRTIPGFDFGFDVTGNIGLSFRGIWAHEGKCLITVNGVMVNDQAYGNFNFFQSISADMIEKVEIIRGPGSALYGGFAEVAVINVITKKEGSQNVYAKATMTGGLVGNQGFSNCLNANFNIKDPASDSYIAGTVGQNIGYLSTKDYVDNSGNILKFDPKASSRKWNHFVIDSKFKNLFLNFNYNQFDFYAQDGFDLILPKVNGQSLEKTRSNSWALRTKYKMQLGRRIKLYPTFEYNKTSPVAYGTIPSQPLFNNMNPSVETSRVLSELICQYEKNKSSLIVGIGYIHNIASGYDQNGVGYFFSKDKKDTVSTQTTSQKYFLIQGEQNFSDFTFTIGSRIENTTFGNAFAPRAGLTFAKNKFNSKLLYGNSYRIPTVINAFYKTFVSPIIDLKPEKAQTFEVELGYKLLKSLSLKSNVFYITINDPIVYLSSSNSYYNYGKQSTVGFEFELKQKVETFNSYFTASYYKPINNTSADFLTLDKRQFLGLSPLKLTAGISKEIKKIQLSPSVVFYGKKIGQGASTPIDNNITFDQLLLLNMNIGYNLNSNFKILIGVNNLLDSKYYLVQPYYGYHAAMPALERNIFAKLSYEFN